MLLNFKNILLLVLVLALVPVLSANDYGYVSRSWENQSDEMYTSLNVQVQVVQYDAQGNPHYTTETRWVHVYIRIPEEAPLRKGEVEYFRVSGYSSGSSSTVNIHINPELTYHSYQSAYTSAFGHGSAHVNLYHGGRIKNKPPVTIENFNVEFTSPEAPVILSFDDFAYDINEEATAIYSFEIKRDVFIFPNKLVAKGQIVRPAEGRPTIIITKDSAYTEGAAEYFKSGKTYLIYMNLKREGSEYYNEKWSPEARYKFKWENGKNIQLERINVETSRTTVRNEKFGDIYQD